VIGNFHSENPGINRGRPLPGIRVRDHKRVGDQYFMSPEDEENLHFRITKSNFRKKGELHVGPS
jgi:hypothetical protein